MNIRTYEDGDAHDVAVLCNKFQDYLVALDPEKQLRRTPEYGEWSVIRKVKKSQSEKCGFYVNVDQGKIVGFVFGCVDPIPPIVASYSNIPIKSGTIEELYVDSDYRMKGLGSALTSKIEEFFKREGCARINLGVFIFNMHAQKMYEHLDYKPRSIHFTKNLNQ